MLVILVEQVAVVEQLEEIFVEVGKIAVEVVEKQVVEVVGSFGKLVVVDVLLVELVVLEQRLLGLLLELVLGRHEPLGGLLVVVWVEELGAYA